MRTETRTAPVAPGIGGIPYKWLALSVTMVGTLMAAIDSSIVVLAFPAMLVDLRADLTSLIWVLMGYSLMTTVSLLNRGIGLGFTSPIILGLFGASVAFGVAFYFWSRAAFVDGMHAALHLSIAICTIAAIGWWFAAAPADDPARRSAAPAVSLPAE